MTMLVRKIWLGKVNGEEGQMDSDKQGKCGNRESTELGLSLNGWPTLDNSFSPTWVFHVTNWELVTVVII